MFPRSNSVSKTVVCSILSRLRKACILYGEFQLEGITYMKEICQRLIPLCKEMLPLTTYRLFAHDIAALNVGF